MIMKTTTEKLPLPFDYIAAHEFLTRNDPHLADVITRTGEFQFKLDECDSVYESLLEAIVYQSISGKAAAKIFSRIQALGANGVCPTPVEILKTRIPALRKAGLSKAKALAMKDLAQKTIDGIVPTLEAAQKMSDEELVERLISEGANTESDIRRVAVMFVDFRSFTAAARSRSPQDVVDRLDGAFAVLVEILDRHGGIVNKFLGDGFLALFGAPFEAAEAPHHAVAAAREMLQAMDAINHRASWPLRIGIGIHFGEVVAGNIGSPRRKEYTVIGDTVNFAARLEALNKQFNSQLLISSTVRDATGDECNDAVSLGEVAVRGYDRPMTVWQLG